MMPQLVQEFISALNAHNVQQLLSLYAADYEGWDVSQVAVQRGIDSLRASLESYLRAFPDLQFVADDVLVDGDRIALAWTGRGTHQGTLLNIPATGCNVQLRGMLILTVQDGKIVQTSSIWDVAGLLRAIGLLPEL